MNYNFLFFANQNTIPKVYKMDMTGKCKLLLRKALKLMTEELKTFEEVRDEYKSKNNIDNDTDKKSKKWKDFMAYLEEIGQQEIKVTWEPAFTDNDMNRLSLSPQDIDILEASFLYESDEAKEERLRKEKEEQEKAKAKKKKAKKEEETEEDTGE